MKIVENNKIICDTKDLMKIFKERQLAVKISNEDEYDIFIEMAKEAGFYIPEGICFEAVKKRPCLHLSQLAANKEVLCCDSEKWCREAGFIRPYKVVSYDEFIHMGCEPEAANSDNVTHHIGARGCGKGMRILSTFIDELSEDKIEPVGFKGGKRPSIFSKDSENTGLEMKPSEDGIYFKLTPLNDAFEAIRKGIHQGLVDEVMNQPYDIHISSDGKTSTARFYVNGKLVRTAEAKCHPVDRFNFHTGAEVAFNRLWEKQPKEKKTVDLNNLKPGDKVRVRMDLKALRLYGNIGTNYAMTDMRGNVVTVTKVESSEYVTSGKIIRIEEDMGDWSWTPEMFELI